MKIGPMIVGAAIGAWFCTFGLIELYPEPTISLGNGNEWTTFVTTGGALVGAFIGRLAWFQRNYPIVLGAAFGLLSWMLWRDWMNSRFGPQPEVTVILGLLAAAIVIGAALGWVVTQRSTPTQR